MILLKVEKIPMFDRLKIPPTHAVCASLSIEWAPYARSSRSVSADFHYGIMVGDQFVQDTSHGTSTFRLPHIGAYGDMQLGNEDRLLDDLFSAQVGKPIGDIHRVDVERIAATYHPALLGSVVE